MNLTAPLWRGYGKSRPQITIHSTLLALPATTEPAGLGPPRTADAGRRSAWILPETEGNRFKSALIAASGNATATSTGLQTGDGALGRLFTGSMIPIGGGSAAIGFTVDLLPHVASHSVKLWVGALSTEMDPAPPDDPSAVRTNFFTACRAALPNGGSLVLQCKRGPDGGGTNYWLIISPTVTDARGKPIPL